MSPSYSCCPLFVYFSSPDITVTYLAFMFSLVMTERVLSLILCLLSIQLAPWVRPNFRVLLSVQLLTVVSETGSYIREVQANIISIADSLVALESARINFALVGYKSVLTSLSKNLVWSNAILSIQGYW